MNIIWETKKSNMARLRKAPAAEGTVGVEVERGGIGRSEGRIRGGAEWNFC